MAQKRHRRTRVECGSREPICPGSALRKPRESSGDTGLAVLCGADGEPSLPKPAANRSLNPADKRELVLGLPVRHL